MSFPIETFVGMAKNAGRSSGFIEATINYIERLEEKKLPVIFSIPHFASLVGMPSKMIKEILEFRNYQYLRFKIPKKRNVNEFREIMSPESKLKYLQRWINKNILQRIELSDSCTAFIPKKSLAVNGYIHRNSSTVLKIDLLKFFDTITEDRVCGYFMHLGYHPNLAVDFAKLCTVKHDDTFWKSLPDNVAIHFVDTIATGKSVLPQGAPTSPQLANLIASSLDNRLIGLSNKLKCRYSRYADDLVFSTTDKAGNLPAVRLIRKIIADEGFVMNDDKVSHTKRGLKQYITGLTVTHGFHVPKKFRQEIFKHLYYAKKYGPFEHLERWAKDNDYTTKTIYGFKDWLLGNISFINSIDIKVAKKMFSEFNKINWGFESSTSDSW